MVEGIFWNNNSKKGHVWCANHGFSRAMRKDFHTSFEKTPGQDFRGSDESKGFIEYVLVPGELL